MYPNRREFLRLAGLAAGSLYASRAPRLTAAPASLRRQGPAQRVIVVGAGLAGLSAAYELVQAGHDVTVLEAETRAGGRVRTLRAPLADGLHAELGAARIPEHHEWTMRYVREFGLELAPFSPTRGRTVRFIRDRRIATPVGTSPDLAAFPVQLTAAERAMGLDGLIGAAFGEALADPADGSPWPPASLLPADQMTPSEFLASRGFSPDVGAVIGVEAFDDYSVLEALGVLHSHGSTPLYRIANGSDELPRAFATRLADRVRYGLPVARIEQDATGVRAICERRGSPMTFAGDRMVCAIPFSVLRHVEVSPQWSPGKQRAIRGVTYASLSRITFQVRERYWLANGDNGFADTDIPGEIWDASLGQPGQRGLLQLYLQGPASEFASTMTEGERIQYGIRQVERVFPGLEPQLEGVFSHCWDNDPWARGAVRLMRVGVRTTIGPDVATPDGRIHFAGEHTSDWYAWMNGALESGHRAADEINQAPAP